MNSDCDAHEHVLRTLGDATIYFEQVGALQSLEAKIVVAKVAVIYDCRIEDVLVPDDAVIGGLADHGRGLACLWVDIGK